LEPRQSTLIVSETGDAQFAEILAWLLKESAVIVKAVQRYKYRMRIGLGSQCRNGKLRRLQSGKQSR